LNEPQPTAQLHQRIPVWPLVAGGLLLILLWGGWKAWRTYQVTQSLLASQTAAESLLADGWRQMDPDAAEELVFDVRRDVVALRREVGFLLPLTPYLGWLPRIGPAVAAAPALMEMADGGTAVAAYSFRGLKPALALLQQENGAGMQSLPKLITIIDGARGDLAQANLAMARVVTARAELGSAAELPWRVRTLLAQADEYLPLAQAGLKLAGVLPEILGQEAPRRYLIIAQNEDELRATGGFISGAGMLVLENGQIRELSFMDANLVDAWSTDPANSQLLTKPYDLPPEPLQAFMLLDLFLFRDANFWPDFPSSGQKAMDLYSYGQDAPPLDGVFAISQRFLQLLVEATGPITLPESGETITSQNLIGSLQAAWTLDEGVTERKSFLATFADAIRQRLEEDFGDIDPVYLARNLYTAAKQKELQLYIPNPTVTAVLADLGWDGRLPNPNNHDFLMVVDTNVGYNKANLYIDRSISYTVDLAVEATPLAALIIEHAHTGPPNAEPCTQGTLQEYVNREDYLALADKCYWNYLRVYAPAGSQLLESPTHIIPAASWYGRFDWDRPTQIFTEQPGLSTFANYLLVPHTEQVLSRYTYALPGAVLHTDGGVKQYRLQVARQAGTRPFPLLVVVRLPAGAELLSAQPAPTAVEGAAVTFVTDFASDMEYRVTYR